MYHVILDFNGTMLFDSPLHTEAWSILYQELYPMISKLPDPSVFCGPRNDAILQNIAPFLDAEQRRYYSEKKEALYRRALSENSRHYPLVKGLEAFLAALQDKNIPFALASASIKSNIDFFYDHFQLGRWFRREDIIYDDGTFPDKGAMHMEAARLLNTRIENCLIIEDSPSSVRLARENGAGCIVALGRTASPSLLLQMGADHYIQDFSEFDYAWLAG